MEAGHDVREYVFINFDDERFLGAGADIFDEILQAYSSMHAFKPILFFDEI